MPDLHITDCSEYRVPVRLISPLICRTRSTFKNIFYEEIAAIGIDDKDANIIYAGLNFGGGLYVSLNGSAS
jgi:hypothetical protein